MCEVLIIPYLEILYYVRTLESRFKLIKKLAWYVFFQTEVSIFLWQRKFPVLKTHAVQNIWKCNDKNLKNIQKSEKAISKPRLSSKMIGTLEKAFILIDQTRKGLGTHQW